MKINKNKKGEKMTSLAIILSINILKSVFDFSTMKYHTHVNYKKELEKRIDLNSFKSKNLKKK
jgi:hypothetical protein